MMTLLIFLDFLQIHEKTIVSLIRLTHAAACHQKFYNNFDKL